MSETQMLIGAITALSGAVVYLHRELSSRLKACEEDRQALWRRLERLWGKVCGTDDDAEAAAAGPPPGG